MPDAVQSRCFRFYDAAKTTHAECVTRAGATPRTSRRLKAEPMGSLPPEVEVWAAFRFVLRFGAFALLLYGSSFSVVKTGLKSERKAASTVVFTSTDGFLAIVLCGFASNNDAWPSTNSVWNFTIC